MSLYVEQISAGGSHTMFLTKDNKLYIVGNNGSYQFGFFSPSSSFKSKFLSVFSLPIRKPKLIKSPSNEKIIKIAASQLRSYLFTEDKNIYVSGNGYTKFTQVNLKNLKEKVENIYPKFNGLFIDTATGNTFSVELIRKGDIATYYVPFFRQINKIKNYALSKEHELQPSKTIKRTPILTSVALGEKHALSLRKKEKVVCVNGENTYGQLGNLKFKFIATDNCQKITIPDGVKKICAGPYNSFVINKEGKVYAFGRNDFGQLGLGHKNNQSTPILIDALKNHNIIEVIAGCYHTFFITNYGDVFGCGNNNCGQLLLPKNIKYATTPQIINKLKYPRELK